jgi:hypothetical protein
VVIQLSPVNCWLAGSLMVGPLSTHILAHVTAGHKLATRGLPGIYAMREGGSAAPAGGRPTPRCNTPPGGGIPPPHSTSSGVSTSPCEAL